MFTLFNKKGAFAVTRLTCHKSTPLRYIRVAWLEHDARRRETCFRIEHRRASRIRGDGKAGESRTGARPGVHSALQMWQGWRQSLESYTRPITNMMGLGDTTYSVADQAARYAQAQALPDERHLDIDTVYDGTQLKGMRVLVTGAEQGLGLEVMHKCLWKARARASRSRVLHGLCTHRRALLASSDNQGTRQARSR